MMDRRTFLKGLVAGVAGLSLSPQWSVEADQEANGWPLRTVLETELYPVEVVLPGATRLELSWVATGGSHGHSTWAQNEKGKWFNVDGLEEVEFTIYQPFEPAWAPAPFIPTLTQYFVNDEPVYQFTVKQVKS